MSHPENVGRTTEQTFALRFKREVQFPRFAMAAGEIWDCTSVGKTGREYLNAVATSAGRFPFAGGICLLEDVELVAGPVNPTSELGEQRDLWESAA